MMQKLNLPIAAVTDRGEWMEKVHKVTGVIGTQG